MRVEVIKKRKSLIQGERVLMFAEGFTEDISAEVKDEMVRVWKY